MQSFLVWLGVVVGTFSFVAPASAQHWPRFRGPSGSGVADSQPLRTAWDGTTGEGVLWKTALPGLGHSSPVVWGDRIFITTAVSATPRPVYSPKNEGTQPATDDAVHEWRVLALDRNSGKILWSRTAHRGAPKRKRHVKATQANASAATDGRIVVAAFGSEGLYAYDFSGNLLWQHDLGVLDPGYAGQPDRSTTAVTIRSPARSCGGSKMTRKSRCRRRSSARICSSSAAGRRDRSTN